MPMSASVARLNTERYNGFAFVICLLVVLDVANPATLEWLLAPLTMLTVSAISMLLGWMDMAIIQSGSVISHVEGFAYDIHYRCTGYRPLLLLAGLQCVVPRTTDTRRVLTIGAAILLSANLLRLLSLFWLGVRYPVWFELAHEVMWPLTLLAIVFCLWMRRWAPTPAARRLVVLNRVSV